MKLYGSINRLTKGLKLKYFADWIEFIKQKGIPLIMHKRFGTDLLLVIVVNCFYFSSYFDIVAILTHSLY